MRSVMRAIPSVWVILGLFFLLLLASSSVFAISSKDFFHEEVEVQGASLSEQRRAQAARTALERVLTRLSGNSSVLTHERVVAALANSTQYLLSYSTATSSRRVVNEQGQEVAVTRVIFDFDPRAVEAILQANGLPIWDLNRPPVLFWWIMAVEGERKILADLDGSFGSQELKQILKGSLPKEGDINIEGDVVALIQEGMRQGIEVRLPIMNAEERRTIRAATISGFMLDDLLAASKRYGVEHLVVGRSSQMQDGAWQTSWQWISPQAVKASQGSSGNVNELFSGVNQQVARYLSDQYAMVLNNGAGEQWWLEVSDVGLLSHYEAMDTYLRGIPSVETLRLASIKASTVCYQVMLRSDLAQFQRLVRQSRKLIEVVSTDTQESSVNRLDTDNIARPSGSFLGIRSRFETGHSDQETAALEGQLQNQVDLDQSLSEEASTPNSGALTQACAGLDLGLLNEQKNTKILRYRIGTR